MFISKQQQKSKKQISISTKALHSSRNCQIKIKHRQKRSTYRKRQVCFIVICGVIG